MRISALRLAREIAARLAPVTPPPFAVRAEGEEVQILHPGSWDSRMTLDWIEDPLDDRAAAELAEIGVGNALDGLQNAVSESTREPWPPLSPTGAPRAMTMYGTHCDGTRIMFWNGTSEESAVISFHPAIFRPYFSFEESPF